MTELLRRPSCGLTSLIIPTYNPGPDIERTWHQLADFVRKADDPWEVIFVCDGCTDGTPDRLRALGATSAGPLRLLEYPENRGKGHAVRTGFAAARGRWFVFTDADLAYGPDDVARVADRLRGGAAVAIGSREHPDSEMVLPASLAGYTFRRHLQSLAFGWLARIVLGFPYRDSQAGLKGMHAAVARFLLPRLSRTGFAFDCELLAACARLGIAVEEVPVRVRFTDRRTTTSFRSSVRAVRDLFAIRRDWRRAEPAAVPNVDVECGEHARAA
jgi:dolichyl-phosphate beta-glucosyltransferase